MLKKVMIIILLIGVSGWGIPSSGDQQKQDKPPIEKPPPLVKPDIVLESVKITSEPALNRDKVKITVEFEIYNDATVPTRCCPTEEGKKAWADYPPDNLLFKCDIQVRSSPNTRFGRFGSTSTELKPFQRSKIRMSKSLDKGKIYDFRVRSDPQNWINEKNENNNQMTKTWPSFQYK